MTQKITVRVDDRRTARDVSLYQGEGLEAVVIGRPEGAVLHLAIGPDAASQPLVQVEGTDRIHVSAEALAVLPLGHPGRWALWLETGGGMRLVRQGRFVVKRSLWPQPVVEAPLPVLSVGAGQPRLIVDGDSVMANPGMRDLILLGLGDRTLAGAGYNQATGGHTVADMLAGLPAALAEVVAGETLVVMGPVGANRVPGATLADETLQLTQLYDAYLDAGAVVVAIPTLPDAPEYGNDAHHSALAQVTWDLAASRPGLIPVDIAGFDPATMKDDRTHPNVRAGGPFLAERVRRAAWPLLSGTRLASGAENLLGDLASFAGTEPLSAPGVTGTGPTGWAVSRVTGSADWQVARDGADLVISTQAAPEKSALQLRADIAVAGLMGDAFDALAEVIVEAGSTGFGGLQALTGDGTLLGGLVSEAMAVPEVALYPRTKAVPLAADTPTLPVIFRLGVTQGGSVTYRVRRAGLFRVADGQVPPASGGTGEQPGGGGTGSGPAQSAGWESAVNYSAELVYADADRSVTAAPAISGIRNVRSRDPLAGKTYFEIEAVSGLHAAGVSSDGVTALAGGTIGTGRAYWSGGLFFAANGPFGMGASIADGEVVQVAVDADAGRIWLRRNGFGAWNNAAGADPATGAGGIDISAVTGPLYAYGALQKLAGAEIALHGTADRFRHTPPAGFAALL